MAHRFRFAISILVLASLWVGVNIYKSPLKVGADADFTSITIAANILNYGVYSSNAAPGPDGLPTSTRHHPPGYPVFLAGVALVDHSVADALTCYAMQRLKCSIAFQFQSVIALQFLLSVGALILGFLAAYQLSQSVHVANLTTILIALFGQFDRYAEILRPGAFFYFTIFAAVFFIARACKTRSTLSAFMAGASFGVAGLFNPFYLIAGAVTVVLLPLALGESKLASGRHIRTMTVSCGLGLALVAGAWMTRSVIVFDDVWMFSGYLGRMTAQRVAFNQTDWHTFAASFVYWLPTYGDALAGAIFDEATYEPLKLSGKRAFIHVGDTAVWPGAVSESGSREHAAMHLIRSQVLPDAVWHTVTSVQLLLRGVLGAGDLPTLVGLCLVGHHLRVERARDAGWGASLILLPLPLAIAAQAALTPNAIWQCLPIILVFTYVASRRFGAL